MPDRSNDRERRTASGTAHVGKGEKVSTSGPLGGGSRPSGNKVGTGNNSEQVRPSNSQRASGAYGNYSSGGNSARSGGLNLRSLIFIVLAIVVLVSLFRSCSGSKPSYYDSNSGSYQSSSSASDHSSIFDASNFQNYYQTSNDYQGLQSSSASSSASEPQAQASYSNVDQAVSNEARDKYITPLGNGRDTVTVMLYMCGTDLESKYGMATSDLKEMASANISDKLNIIVETGGCKRWQISGISNSVNQIYKVETGKLIPLEDNLGSVPMTDPRNLTSFIDYCEENYPADRNILILWDHGGGSISGYGYDEKFTSASPMSLASLDKALADADCIFDWIGFDACLMATLENAIVCEKYADYLIASEESEPGTGWYYTDWVNQISSNTSTDTLKLSKTLIDSFIQASCSSSSRAQVTLSCMDLAELDGTVPNSFKAFSASVSDLVDNDYAKVSKARSATRQFAASNRINQVDLIDLCDRLGTDESKEFAEVLRSVVKYNKTTISKSYGVSIYFPYENLRTMNAAVSVMKSIGLDDYSKCITKFASVEQSGQIASSSTQSQYGSLFDSYSGYSNYSSSGYGTEDLLNQFLQSYSQSYGSSYGGGNSGYSSYSNNSPLGSLFGNYSGSSSGGGYSSGGSGYSIDASQLIGLLSGLSSYNNSGRSMPENLIWLDTETAAASAEYIAGSFLDPSEIRVSQNTAGENVLALSDAQWDQIDTAELNLYVDDGEGFIDMGYDPLAVYFDDNGNMLTDWDRMWIAVNDIPVAYYTLSDVTDTDGTRTVTGKIPAILNGEMVYLMVVTDDEYNGEITGAYPVATYNGEQGKGNIEIRQGDRLEFLCDYYSYDGSYEASYTLENSSLTVGPDGIYISIMELDNEEVSVMYRLTNLYGYHYWLNAN